MFRRLPGGELHEREILSRNYSNGPKLSEAVESIAEILQSNKKTNKNTKASKKDIQRKLTPTSNKQQYLERARARAPKLKGEKQTWSIMFAFSCHHHRPAVE